MSQSIRAFLKKQKEEFNIAVNTRIDDHIVTFDEELCDHEAIKDKDYIQIASLCFMLHNEA